MRERRAILQCRHCPCPVSHSRIQDSGKLPASCGIDRLILNQAFLGVVKSALFDDAVALRPKPHPVSLSHPRMLTPDLRPPPLVISLLIDLGY